MKDIGKKILGGIATVACLTSVLAFAGCKEEAYKGKKLENTPATEATVDSNGGFAVQKGDYVYFINGMQSPTANNTYGKVVKGALMRIPAADLQAGDYADVETVVPMLFVAQNFDAGVYIYGDYVYYATPTTDKNLSGTVENSWIDFKRAKLDGSEAMSGYYFRLSDNTSTYRFVEENGVVYCLYEEDSALKSYNTKTGKHTTLVKGAKSEFFYDKGEDGKANGNVYYTMNVPIGNEDTSAYDQIYCVNAAATVSKVDEGAASYTVTGGKTYDFDKSYLSDNLDGFKASDYTTYPYVNLGQLVLDGVGKNAAKEENYTVTQFNGKEESVKAAATTDGYNYTISSYQNGGIYFTRTEVSKTSSDATDTKLYYLADSDRTAEGWDVVADNASDKIDVVALNTTNASTSAIFYIENDKHYYFYLADNTIYKASQPDANGVVTKIDFEFSYAGVTLWQIDGDYLYYYTSGDVSRVRHNGTQDQYSQAYLQDGAETDEDEYTAYDEYKPMTLKGVQWNTAWYKPEIFGDVVLYSNAQTFGASDATYNYVYAAKLGTVEAIKARNNEYDKVQEYIDDEYEKYNDNGNLKNLMTYYFRTGETAAYEAVIDLYDEENEQKAFDEFKKKFAAETDKFQTESYFYALVGKMTSSDKAEIAEAWEGYLLSETDEAAKESDGLPGWAIALIVIGGVVIVATAVLVPVLLAVSKKKAKAKEAEETVNAYKRKKIDTTDDKTIDVYADETAEAAAETTVEAQEEKAEATEVGAEETTETPVEEVATEAVEAPVEEENTQE